MDFYWIVKGCSSPIGFYCVFSNVSEMSIASDEQWSSFPFHDGVPNSTLWTTNKSFSRVPSCRNFMFAEYWKTKHSVRAQRDAFSRPVGKVAHNWLRTESGKKWLPSNDTWICSPSGLLDIFPFLPITSTIWRWHVQRDAQPKFIRHPLASKRFTREKIQVHSAKDRPILRNRARPLIGCRSGHRWSVELVPFSSIYFGISGILKKIHHWVRLDPFPETV